MGMFDCDKCKKTLWLSYHRLPDGTTVCNECYAKYLKKHELYVGETYEVLYNFVKKYRNEHAYTEFEKLKKLMEVKYKLNVDQSSLKAVLEDVKKTVEEEEEKERQKKLKKQELETLEEFESQFLGKKSEDDSKEPISNKPKPKTDSEKLDEIHKKIETNIGQKDNGSDYYCIVCKNPIDKNTFFYTKQVLGKPLCPKHQGTKYQKKLFKALKEREINCEYEAYDGYKHVDIAVHTAKLYIEIDGKHHLIDPMQLGKDLKRDEFSSKNGYATTHISNREIEENVDSVANALAGVVKQRQENK